MRASATATSVSVGYDAVRPPRLKLHDAAETNFVLRDRSEFLTKTPPAPICDTSKISPGDVDRKMSWGSGSFTTICSGFTSKRVEEDSESSRPDALRLTGPRW